ncbi:MAG: multidrug transporter, partial [Bacteroidetes bacterium]|nr:multidrug transporter [Bacteroidota bacterium]
MAGMNLVVPFLPFYIRQLGVTDPTSLARWSGLVFAGPFFLSFIATPVWGSLGDRYGRKMMVVRALIGLAISQLLIGFAQDVIQLLIFRVVQGAISGFIAANLALVSTNTPKERMGYAIGFLQSATAAGTVLGPAVGGLLADLIGYREIFFITAALCFIAGMVVLASVVEQVRPGQGERSYSVFDNARFMWNDRRIRIVGFTMVIGQLSVLMIEPIFALFVEGLSAGSRYVSTLTGAVFSVSGFFMVIAAPWWGRRNDKTGFRRNLTIALTVVGLAYLLHTVVGVGLAYLLHTVVGNLIQLAALRAVLGFARGGVLPALYSIVSLLTPAERRGGTMAIASSLTVLGNMIGPMMGGMIAGTFGITATFVANGALLLLTSLLVSRQL